MSRRFVAVILPLAVLAVDSPRAVAGPPQGVSGRLKFDEVAEGLRHRRPRVFGLLPAEACQVKP